MSADQAKTRIYHVKDSVNDKIHLIRAVNKIQALGHVAQSQFQVAIADQDALVSAVSAGVAVVDAKVAAD
jgi:hypothetical protein